jgi:hypothetical protein
MLTDNTIRTYIVSKEIYEAAHELGYNAEANVYYSEPCYEIKCTASEYAILKELTK